VRALTWWHVAVLAADGRLPEGVSADPQGTPDLGDVPANLAFGRELAARIIRKAKPERPYLLTTPQVGEELGMPSFGVQALSGPLYVLLAKTEREALRVVENRARRPRTFGTESAVDYPGLRTVDDLPDGYVADVLRQTNCKPKEPVELAGAIVRYTPRKHLQELQWVATPLKSPCAEAARYILAAALLPAPVLVKPGARNWIVLPMREQFLQCLAGGSRLGGADVERAGQKGIVPPRKIRDMRPEYPAMALNGRRQGVVIVEATISPAGCVDRAEIKQGAAMDFDLEALRAVTGWGFTPTLLNGRAVPVVMTVTVAFTLQ
jgi:TonB family protein